MTITCAEFERILDAIRSQSVMPTHAERAAALEHYDDCLTGQHTPADFGRGAEPDLTPEEVSDGRRWCAFLEACGALRSAHGEPRGVARGTVTEANAAEDLTERRRAIWRSFLALNAPVAEPGWKEVAWGFRLRLALPEQIGPMLGGQGFDVAAPVEGSTLNGQVRWRIVEEGPEVIVNFETDFEDFLGRSGIRLRWGEAAEEVVFARCAGRVVGVVVVSKAQLGASRGRDVPFLEVPLTNDEPSG